MFSVNNFYDYLTHQYGWPNKNNKNFVYAFNQHGNRNLWNLVALCEPKFLEERTKNLSIDRFYSRIYLLDQEPINFELFEINHYSILDDRKKWFDIKLYEFYSKNLSKFRQFTTMLSTFNDSIICHSEINSNEVKLLERHGFISCYYFYHALISRDWFRHWKHYTLENNKNSKRFGIYARDASGTRSYRLEVLNDLLHINDQVYFEIQPKIQAQINNQQIFNAWDPAKLMHNSDASAAISWQDCKKFQIQIVAETLFDTEKIHLTEKAFKPIVMRQPFILFAGPGSLKYLKSYGFKTFDSVWDEGYDLITNTESRYKEIIKLIFKINQLPKKEFDLLMTKVEEIVEYNCNHFFSSTFENQLLHELDTNMTHALHQQTDRFLNFNTSGLLNQIDYLYQRTGTILPKSKELILNILEHTKKEHPKIADQVIKKYRHLF